MEPDDFENIDEYYAARERDIVNRLLNGEKLDFEDLDYIDNNFNFVTLNNNEEVFIIVDDRPRFFKFDLNHQPREVKLVGKLSYSWEYV